MEQTLMLPEPPQQSATWTWRRQETLRVPELSFHRKWAEARRSAMSRPTAWRTARWCWRGNRRSSSGCEVHRWCPGADHRSRSVFECFSWESPIGDPTRCCWRRQWGPRGIPCRCGGTCSRSTTRCKSTSQTCQSKFLLHIWNQTRFEVKKKSK